MPITDEEVQRLLAVHDRNRRQYARLVRIFGWLYRVLRIDRS